MTIGARVSVIALLVMLFSTPLQAQDDLAAAIFQQLGAQQHSAVRYVEKKYLKIIDVPLTQSGRLLYQPPDRLIREQLTPNQERFTFEGRQVTIQNGSSTKKVSLERLPALQVFLDSLKAVMAGDRTALQRNFSVAATGSLDHWTLALTPLNAQLRPYVTRIQFEGNRSELTRIKTYEVDGDWSDMELRPDTTTDAQ
jgi:outer membrane lipoprotein-sorting protein